MEHEGLKTHKALPISVFNYFIISAKNYGESAIYASELEKLFEGDSKQRAINYWCIAGGIFLIILPEAHISYLDAYSARQKPQTTKEYIHSFWKVIVAVTYALPVIDSLNELNGFKWEDDGYLDTRASWGFSITMGFLSCIYYYIALSSAKLNETLCSKFWLTFTNIIATVFCAEIYLTYNSMRSIIVSATHGEEHYSRWLGAIAALIVFMAKLLYKSEGEKNIIKFFYHKISCSKDQAVIICGVKEFQQQTLFNKILICSTAILYGFLSAGILIELLSSIFSKEEVRKPGYFVLCAIYGFGMALVKGFITNETFHNTKGLVSHEQYISENHSLRLSAAIAFLLTFIIRLTNELHNPTHDNHQLFLSALISLFIPTLICRFCYDISKVDNENIGDTLGADVAKIMRDFNPYTYFIFILTFVFTVSLSTSLTAGFQYLIEYKHNATLNEIKHLKGFSESEAYAATIAGAFCFLFNNCKSLPCIIQLLEGSISFLTKEVFEKRIRQPFSNFFSNFGDKQDYTTPDNGQEKTPLLPENTRQAPTFSTT